VDDAGIAGGICRPDAVAAACRCERHDTCDGGQSASGPHASYVPGGVVAQTTAGDSVLANRSHAIRANASSMQLPPQRRVHLLDDPRPVWSNPDEPVLVAIGRRGSYRGRFS
jgi:hypothetical protein